MNDWMVVINPWAGSGLGKTEWPQIEGLLKQKGFNIKSVFTEHHCHAIDIVKDAVAKGYRKFIAVGGDGTLHEVINGTMFQDIVPTSELSVGCIPVGSGNDWIKMYDIPSDYSGAIDVIAQGNIQPQDLAKVTFDSGSSTDTRYMMNIGGALLDGNTVCEFTKLKIKNNGTKNSSNTYLRGIIRSFVKTKTCHVDMTVDGQPFYSGGIISVAFGIGPYSGGGLLQTPDAEPDDGLLDMTVLKRTGKLRLLFNIKRLFDGTILKFKRALHSKLTSLKIESARPINLEIDGESVGTTPFSIEMVPAAVRVFVPATSK